MWAPRIMDEQQIRQVPGLDGVVNRAWTGDDPDINPRLTHLSRTMSPAIEQVSEHVYSAVGFDVANSTFVVGQDGILVIDAMTSIENMTAALTAFREICDYPVKGVLYTHSHGDHWAGSPGLFPGGIDADVPVIAQRQLMAEVGRINGFNQPIMQARSAYQFGDYLEPGPQGVVNVGAGPFLSFGQQAGLVPPNLLVDERLELSVAGIDLEIVWVPSEAPDEIVVWLPQHGVLQSAECIQGECYPNLYTLRGDVPRPAAQWVQSLDVLRRFPAEALAKSHGRSVVGVEAARDHLRNYRDVIAWTHDQTVRWMNRGRVPDQIVEAMGEMPPHLRAYETTGLEGYGSVAHGSRSIYSWYLGFNQGEVTDFDPAPYDERQRGYVDAMGGPERVCEIAQDALDHGHEQWAIELVGYLVRSEPHHAGARRISAEAHRRRGYQVGNSTWRNWYLTAAEELEGRVPIAKETSGEQVLMTLPLTSLMTGLPVRLRAEATWYVETSLGLRVGGAEPGEFTLLLRRGVLEVEHSIDDAAVLDAEAAFTDKAALVAYLLGTTLVELEAAGAVVVTGNGAAAADFARYFDPPSQPGRILVTSHGEMGAGT